MRLTSARRRQSADDLPRLAQPHEPGLLRPHHGQEGFTHQIVVRITSDAEERWTKLVEARKEARAEDKKLLKALRRLLAMQRQEQAKAEAAVDAQLREQSCLPRAPPSAPPRASSSAPRHRW